IAQPSHFLNRGHHALRMVHLRLRGPPQNCSHQSLKWLEKDHGQKQQERRRSLRRHIGLHPDTHAPNQTQIKESEERRENRINKISLPPNLQKIELLHVTDKRN